MKTNYRLNYLYDLFISPFGLSLGVFSLLLGFYTLTLLPSTVGGDAGELQYTGHILALPHPTGFPLYTLLSYLWSHLFPVGSVAWKMNFFSAVWGASACAIFAYFIGRVYGRGIGVICGLTVGMGAVFWGEAVIADKYAFNAFWCSWVIGLSVVWVREQKQPHADRLLYALSLAFGLSLLHHRTMILFAPALAVLVLWSENIQLWRDKRRTLLCLSLVILPSLILYPLILPWLSSRAGSPIEWRPTTFNGWLDWLLERHAVQMALGETGFREQLQNYLNFLQGEYTLIGVVGGLFGWLTILKKQTRLALFLALAFLLQAGLAANSRNNPRTFTFFIPSFMVMAVCYGAGLAWLWEQMQPILARFAPRRVILIGGLLLGLCLPAYQFSQTYPERQLAASYGEPLDLWRSTLKTANMGERFSASLADLPPKTLLVMDWEQLTITWYLQRVDGVRPDIEMDYPIERVVDYLNQYEGSEPYTLTRPICLSRHFPLAGAWKLTNHGALICVVNEPQTVLSARAIPLNTPLYSAEGEHMLSLAGYEWGGSVYQRGQFVPLLLTWHAKQAIPDNYSVSLKILTENWVEVWKYDIQAPVMGLYGTSRWSVGEMVQDYYELDLAPDLPTGNYFWGVTLYRVREDGTFEQLQDEGGNQLIFGSTLTITD